MGSLNLSCTGESEIYLANSTSPAPGRTSTTYLFNEVYLYEICIYVMVGTFCMTINVGAFCIVRLKRGPPTFLSLVNLFISSLLAVIYQILKTLKKSKILSSESLWLCNGWGLCSRLCIVLLPFTMVGIFMEMINAKRLVQCGMRLEVAIFLSVWFSSVLISIPAMGTYKFEDTVNPSTLSHCSRVFILDSQLLTNLYEGLFVCSISVLPTFFMLGALHRLKFRMHLLLLCQPIPHGLHKKVRKIRWIFFYTVFFIVFWLAPGPAIYIVRLTDKRGESQVPGQRQTPRDFPLVLRCGFLLQVAMQPLFFLYAQQQFNLWEWFQRCPIVKCLCSRAVGRMRRRRKTLRGMEISSIMHMETYAVSSQGQLNNLYY